MSAVTIPNIPAEPSAWLRMWQWNAQAPGRPRPRSRPIVRPARRLACRIKPGETYTYAFTAGPFGRHMYHSHHNATEQVGRGMLGPLVVAPKNKSTDPQYDKEEFFIFNDALCGLTINGKGFPATVPYTAKLGQRIRFRFMGNAW